MLNPFPIQFLALLAYFILRVFVAGILMYLGIRHLQYREELKHVLVLSWWPYGTFTVWVFALGEMIISLFVIVGAYTQYAMIFIMVMSLKMLLMRQWFDHKEIPPKIFYLLLFGVAATLFITGAGALAFDLPI